MEKKDLEELPPVYTGLSNEKDTQDEDRKNQTNMEEGQGKNTKRSALSLILYNIYTRDIPKKPTHTKVYMYINDPTMWTRRQHTSSYN